MDEPGHSLFHIAKQSDHDDSILRDIASLLAGFVFCAGIGLALAGLSMPGLPA